MRFLRLDLVYWWQAVPILIACWALHYHYVRRVRRLTPIAPRFLSLSHRSTPLRETAILVTTLVVAAALVFALLRPQVLFAERVPELERQDLVVMLDRSASMRAHDVRPSRFARATSELRNFLIHKPDAIDRVGLVGFADASVILSYLTGDVDAVLFYLDWLDRDPQTLLGTDIGAALKSGLEVARRDTTGRAKIFLLISDGEDFGAELSRQVAAYRAAGFHVHCIGIGSDDEVPVPLLRSDGTETYLRDEANAVVKTRFSESTLREIAAATGGRYARSTTGAELARAIDTIVAGERRTIGFRTTTDYHDLYPAALGVAGAAGALLWVLL